MSESLPHFMQVQYQFTRHLRDPENNPAPEDTSDERIGMYRELVYNNLEGFMSNNFPVIRQITSDIRWCSMIRDFLIKHECHTPLFSKLPLEFLHYLENERMENDDPPFLVELAHYEWIESAITNDMREADRKGLSLQTDLLNEIPVLNQVHKLQAYTYAVHLISPEVQPDTAPDTHSYLAIFRDVDDKAAFIELNPVTARLLERILNEPDLTGKTHLHAIAEELGHSSPDTVISGGHNILLRLHERGLILGSRK